MAKKNVPISKPKGTDSQGNIQVPGGPVVLDLGDFDDIFGPLETDAKDEGPLDQFWTGMKESFKDRVRTKDVVRNFLRSAAPDGISNLMGFADEAMSATRDIKDSLERTNASDLQYIAKRAQALLPQLKDYAPDGLYNDISQGLENKIDEYDYTVQAQRDQTPIRRAAQEQRDNSDIKAALDNISLTERLNHNRSEQAAQSRHQQTRAEESIRDVLKTKRFDFMARSMGMVADGVQRVAGYNEQVNYGFQRKGLELQFRTFLGIKELVKLNEANLELQARAYTAMIRNTGMTDFQKNGQKGLDQMPGQGNGKPGFGSRIGAKVANKTLSHFLGNYGNEAQGRVTKDLSQKLSMAVMAMKMGQGGPSMWDQKYKMAGSFAGDAAGDFLLNELIPMLGREARPGLTNLSNKHAGGKHNQIGYYLDNMPAFLQEFVNNGQNQHGFKGKIRDMISPYVPQFGLQDRTTSGNFQTIDQPAQFNQLTQRTIVDALPGYLARMLQELRMIRTGRDDVAREVWDVTSGTFKAESVAHDALQAKIIPKSAIRSASSTINDALNTMDEDGKLSPTARKALSERMLRDSSTNRRFDPDSYIKARGYAKDVPPEVAQELDQFFRGKFEFDDNGSMKDTADNHKLRQEFSQAFLDIRSISRDPIKEIQRMIESGNTEPLRAIGIIITEDNVDKINYPRIWEILRSGVTDGNPFAPGGNGFDPTKDDKSGIVGHKDFMGPDFPGAEAAWAKNKMIRFRGKYAPEEQAARDKMAKHLKSMRGRFSTASDRIQDMASGLPGQFGDLQQQARDAGGYSQLLSGKYKGQMQGMLDSGMAGFDQFVGKASNTVNDVAAKAANRSEEMITDLYSQFDKNYPALRAKDLANGSLIDVNTKKVITKLSDITGKVINMAGETILSANEVAAGLMNPNGDIVLKVISDAGSKVSDAIAKNMPKAGAASATEDQDPNAPDTLNKQDWSLGPGEAAILTARGMLNGEYFDGGGKVLTSVKDIAGDVYDKLGNIVITGKEFANGLWSKRTGARYRPTKGFARLLRLGKAAGQYSGSTATTLAWTATKFMAKAAVGIGSRVFNIFADNQNAYLLDSKLPVFTRRAVQNGEYFDEKGNVIEDFVDVYSLIHDKNGELVLPAEQYKDLKNYDGTRHVLAKNKRIWGKYIMRPIRAARNWYMKKTKQYYKALGRKTVQLGGWLGKKTLGGFANIGGNIFNRMFEKIEDPNVKAQIDATVMTSQQQTGVLQEILQELKDQKPKEVRKGSWQDQAANKKAAFDKDGNPVKGEDDDQKDGFLKRGLKGLAGMLGFGKGKGEEEEDGDGFGLSDVADMADIGDAVGDHNERRGRKKGRLGGKGKGRLAKMGSRVMGSRAGQMLASTGGRVMATAGGQMLARGAMMAGTALASLLSAPVLIGAAAVAATAGVAYLGYKRYDSIHGEFRELRLAQYGVDTPTKKGLIDDIWDMSLISFGGDKKKVLELEGLMEKYTDKNSATPSFSISGAGGKEILDIMGIDLDEEADVMVFSRWLEKRFKPVYLAWISGMFKLGQSSISINDIDDKFPNELKADFLDIIKFPYTGQTPYASLDNPFSSTYPLQDNSSTIEKMFADLMEKYAKQRKKKPDDNETKDNAAIKSEAEKGTGAAVAKAAGAAGAGTTGVMAINKLAAEAGKEGTYGSPSVAAGGIAGAAAAAGTLSGNVTLINQRIGNTLTALQSIRMRAYGMQVMSQADVKAVLALEAEYAKDLQATPYSVDYNGDESEFFKKAGMIMGKDTTVGSEDRPKLVNWLADRFGPAFRSYYGAAKNAQPAANLANIESKLTASDRVTVAKAVLGSIAGSGRSIWELPSLFEIKGPLTDLKPMADADLKYLEDQAEKEVASSPTQKASDQMAGKNAAAQGGSFVDKAMGAIKDAWSGATETLSTTWDRAKEATGDAYASAKIAVGMGPEYGEGGATGGVIQSAGNGGTVLAGNGGQWESIPMPSASGSAKAAKPTLDAISKITGVPCDWLMAIAGIESGFRYDVKASTSSATGWYQFINSTWDSMYEKFGQKYGCPPDPGKTRVARKDPRINGLMGAEYIKTNYNGLKKGLGRDNLTDVDVYMAHFLGLGGALKFFRADPNAMAYKIFSKEYSANMPLFFVNAKPGQPRTIAQVYKLFQEKIEKFWSTTGKGLRDGGTTVGAGETPQTPGKTEPEKSVEEQTKDRLAADAKDKAGVAAQAAPGTPAGPGTENASAESAASGTSTAAQPTVASIANGTAPMPGAPATGGGPSTSTTSTGTSSGGGTVDEQRNAVLAQAQSNNTRREAEVRQDQAAAANVNETHTKSLNTLYEIRDLMKTLVNTMSTQASEKGKDASSGASGGNSMTPQTIQSRQAAQRPSALTLR
jgi:hypothetical protein